MLGQQEPHSEVTSLAASPNGRFLAAGVSGGGILVWALQLPPAPSAGGPTSAAKAEQPSVVAAEPLNALPATPPTLVRRLVHVGSAAASHRVMSLCWSADSSELLSVDDGGVARVWSILGEATGSALLGAQQAATSWLQQAKRTSENATERQQLLRATVAFNESDVGAAVLAAAEGRQAQEIAQAQLDKFGDVSALRSLPMLIGPSGQAGGQGAAVGAPGGLLGGLQGGALLPRLLASINYKQLFLASLAVKWPKEEGAHKLVHMLAAEAPSAEEKSTEASAAGSAGETEVATAVAAAAAAGGHMKGKRDKKEKKEERSGALATEKASGAASSPSSKVAGKVGNSGRIGGGLNVVSSKNNREGLLRPEPEVPPLKLELSSSLMPARLAPHIGVLEALRRWYGERTESLCSVNQTLSFKPRSPRGFPFYSRTIRAQVRAHVRAYVRTSPRPCVRPSTRPCARPCTCPCVAVGISHTFLGHCILCRFLVYSTLRSRCSALNPQSFLPWLGGALSSATVLVRRGRSSALLSRCLSRSPPSKSYRQAVRVGR